jgi:peptide/nickel transport system ATP-binding protein
MTLLAVRDLDVRFATADGEVHAVKNANFDIAEGECLGVVGESGSGKSQMFLAAAGLLAGNGRATGSVRWHGEEMLGLSQQRLNAWRGSRLTVVFQDSLTGLTPHMTVGAQIVEVLRQQKHLARSEAEACALAMLEKVGISDAALRFKQYPHEFSGGMRQRVMIAMAAICGPELMIADEPTTALDVTVQAQILDLLRALKTELNSAAVLISHDMGVIASMADRVLVMQNGEIVEQGAVDDIFARPRHPYTQALLAATPRLDRPGIRNAPPPQAPAMLEVAALNVHYKLRSGLWRKTTQHALEGVDFTLRPGETLGIVGESGSGKSTLARAILKLQPKTGGSVVWMGRDLDSTGREEMRRLRRELQIVLQDPLASLDPRRTIGQSIAEPLHALQPFLPRAEAAARVAAMMRRVGLDPATRNRYPHEFSGGQNQRASIARAMIVAPRLLVCDEAVSALDVSIQAQIVELLAGLQDETGMATIFISHDLAVVRRLAHRVLVLHRGRVVETADTETLYSAPCHPYTKALLAAVPLPDPGIQRSRPAAI